MQNLMIRDNQPIFIDLERFAWGHPEWDISMTATEYQTAGWWTDPSTKTSQRHTATTSYRGLKDSRFSARYTRSR